MLVLMLWGRRYAKPSTGILAALLFGLCPIAICASQSSGIDLGASFLCAISFVTMLHSIESGKGLDATESSFEKSLRWSVLAGFLTGAAMGTKYTVFPIGLILILVHYLSGRRYGIPIKNTWAFAFAAFMTLFPWLLKNAVFFHNPLYPFFISIFGNAQPLDLNGFFGASGSQNLRATLTSFAGLRSLFMRPWSASLDLRYLDDWPGPAFLLLVPWVFLFRSEAGRVRAAVLMAVGCYLTWLFTTDVVRYLLPVLPFFACVAALAVNEGPFPGWMRQFGWALALLACAFNLQAAFYRSQRIGTWAYAEPYKSAFLNSTMEAYPAPYYSAMGFIAKNLSPSARVLFLGEERGFYCERDFIASTVYDLNPFWTQLRQSKSAEELQQRLKQMGISHVFLNAVEMLHHRYSDVVMPRADIEGQVFSDFWSRYLHPVFEDGHLTPDNPRWTVLYELRDTPNLDPAKAPLNVPRYLLQPNIKVASPPAS